MTEMIAWLRAQILADKAAADAATPGPWHAEIHRHRHTKVPVLFEVHPVAELEGNGDGGVQTAADAEHIARHDPRDVIADCDAKLAILDEHLGVLNPKGNPDRACRICSDRRADDDPLSSDDRWVRLEPAPCPTVRLLAQGYRHRDGWVEDWAE